MSDFTRHMPDPAAIVALAPQELAAYLMEFFQSIQEKDRQRRVMRLSWIGSPEPLRDYPPRDQEAVSMALMEAWSWLERQGLIAPMPPAFDGNGAFFITKAGRYLKRRTDIEEYRKRTRLPREILHRVIAEKTWPAFVRGEYDTAVFQAFKEVEVAVRAAGGFGPNDLGTDLMRRAFDAQTGPLANPNEPAGEKQALSHLFAGAIGRFKNPSSHRHVTISDAGETFEMLALASHLLRVVDDRRTNRSRGVQGSAM